MRREIIRWAIRGEVSFAAGLLAFHLALFISDIIHFHGVLLSLLICLFPGAVIGAILSWGNRGSSFLAVGGGALGTGVAFGGLLLAFQISGYIDDSSPRAVARMIIGVTCSLMLGGLIGGGAVTRSVKGSAWGAIIFATSGAVGAEIVTTCSPSNWAYVTSAVVISYFGAFFPFLVGGPLFGAALAITNQQWRVLRIPDPHAEVSTMQSEPEEPTTGAE